MERTLIQRIHNPHNYECGCDPDCWCRRTTIGRAVKWWFPARWFGIQHTNRVEMLDFAKKVGVTAPDEAWLRPKDLRAYRDAYCAAIRDYNSRGAPARTWPVRFVIRHSAYHMLDHAWEMEDRDLSGA